MPAVLHTRAFRYALRTVTVLALGALWLYTSLTATIFWGIFLVWAVWRLDSRYVGAGALLLLVAIPITLSLGEEEWGWLAEQLAVYVYFLLCITVGLQMIEMVGVSRKSKVQSEASERETGELVSRWTGERVNGLASEPAHQTNSDSAERPGSLFGVAGRRVNGLTRNEVESHDEYRVAKNVLPATRTSVSETRYPVPSDRQRVPAELKTRDREPGTHYGSPHILDLRSKRSKRVSG